MDTSAFEQVYGAFQDFHAYFGPLFGRREARDHSRHYLQALLVQSGERRNAENLSETVPASARVMQRFLTESPWDDDAVIGRLQEYLSPRLGHPEAVVGAGRQRLPQAGQEVGGSGPAVLREIGQGGQLPGWDVPGIRQPAGAGPGGQTAVSAGELDLGPRPVRNGRGAGGETELPVEDRVGLGAAGAGLGAAATSGPSGLLGTTPSGCRRPSGTGWRRWGCTTCWTFPAAPRCGRWSRLGPVRSIRDSGVPANPSCETVSAGPWSSAAMNCRGMLGGR